MAVPAIVKGSCSFMSASLHGADNLDPVAVVQSGRPPGGARHDRAVERDREALGGGQLQLRGLGAPQSREGGGGAVARLTVDVEPHGLSPEAEIRRPSPPCGWRGCRGCCRQNDSNRILAPRPTWPRPPRGHGSPAR